MKRKDHHELRKNLFSENIDPQTLEDIPERDSGLEDGSEEIKKILKQSYKNLENGRAIVREKAVPIVIFGLLFMLIGGLVLIIYGIAFYPNEGYYIAIIMGVLVFAVSLSVFLFMLRRFIKLYDICFFKQNNGYAIFYINKKYSIYYKNRAEIVCIDNKRLVEKSYTADNFMNGKFGFNYFKGRMTLKENDNGYIIRTKNFKRMTAFMFARDVVLAVDRNLNIKEISFENKYVYKFLKKAGDIVLPKEMLEACGRRNITLPFANERIRFRDKQ